MGISVFGFLLLLIATSVKAEEDNVVLKAVMDSLRNKDGIGNLVQAFMSNDAGGKSSGVGGIGAGDMLSNLANMLSTTSGDDESRSGDGSSTADMLGSIATLLASTSGGNAGDSGAGDLLTNIVSTMQAVSGSGSDSGRKMGDDGANAGGGLDLETIGNIVDMFAKSGSPSSGSSGGGLNVETMINLASAFMGQQQQGSRQQRSGDSQSSGGFGGGLNVETMLNLATAFMGQQQVGKQSSGDSGPDFQGILNVATSLLSAASTNQQDGRSKRSTGWNVMDLLESGWKMFSESELGQHLWKSSGLRNLASVFQKENGEFDIQKVMESLENNSMRRKWIQSITSYIGQWTSFVTDPEIQQKYIISGYIMANNFLRTQGYKPFDASLPAESLANLINSVVKKQFAVKIDSYPYIKPAVAHVQELFKISKSKGFDLSHLSAREIEGKLADLLNNEVIDPALQVWKATQIAKQQPSCSAAILCRLNNPLGDDASIEGLKPGIVKLSSTASAYWLTEPSGETFWTLYDATAPDQDCQELYSEECLALLDPKDEVKDDHLQEAIHSEL